MPEITPVRGVVYRADLGKGPKPFLVVSNNARNQKLDSCLAVRITTTQKPEMTSIVPLGSADSPLVGCVLCDDIVELWRDEIKGTLGALSKETMVKVATGLRAALALL
ncbi:type II toxin-antitoxin system PemK/MazF family toxin [Streptacidiphilus albus]|uniref:type II toxin-antitoxin system PemK/MazF family toxin n=1 Tax=Streptacidiphilus albus TaxID=105425 RepID=UPI0009E0A87B|nr:type II toxin-antitoxin system PemK/MazF family toxin [Streptacidiphilus albus]